MDARDGVNKLCGRQHSIMRWDNIECDVRDIDKWPVCLDYAARDDLLHVGITRRHLESGLQLVYGKIQW